MFVRSALVPYSRFHKGATETFDIDFSVDLVLTERPSKLVFDADFIYLELHYCILIAKNSVVQTLPFLKDSLSSIVPFERHGFFF